MSRQEDAAAQEITFDAKVAYPELAEMYEELRAATAMLLSLGNPTHDEAMRAARDRAQRLVDTAAISKRVPNLSKDLESRDAEPAAVKRYLVWVCEGCDICAPPDGFDPPDPDPGPCTHASPSVNGAWVVLAAEYDRLAATMLQPPEDADHGPFDPEELVRWAEAFGHPEWWAQKAKAFHAALELRAGEERP